MAKNDVVIQSQNQVGQIASALNSRTQGNLPSDTENVRPHGKEHCKAITLRSGTQLDRVGKSIIRIQNLIKQKLLNNTRRAPQMRKLDQAMPKQTKIPFLNTMLEQHNHCNLKFTHPHHFPNDFRITDKTNNSGNSWMSLSNFTCESFGANSKLCHIYE
ncbi:Integrase-like protein [Gossypium australe]|uniref:Integrase-like protein n=1 Tax=Gossypium australe TaxID=47621 RepID=A0A5B6W7G6_9ROSI|nr:Integrase-like protein [Gossypium australe]